MRRGVVGGRGRGLDPLFPGSNSRSNPNPYPDTSSRNLNAGCNPFSQTLLPTPPPTPPPSPPTHINVASGACGHVFMVWHRPTCCDDVYFGCDVSSFLSVCVLISVYYPTLPPTHGRDTHRDCMSGKSNKITFVVCLHTPPPYSYSQIQEVPTLLR